MEPKGLKILIADDFPIMRKGLISIIKSLVKVEEFLEAADGKKVLELAQRHTIDLFFLDFKITHLNGYDLSKALLKLNPKNKIIIITMYSERAFVDKLYDAGAMGVLIKNCDYKEIKDAINKVLNGNIYYDIQVADQYLNSTINYSRNTFSLVEKTLVHHLAKGKISKEISGILELTPKTVEVYRSRLLKKCGVRNTAELLDYCYRTGLL